MGEAVGRASCAVLRLQQPAGPHGDGTNAPADAMQMQGDRGWLMPQARAAAAALLLNAAPFDNSFGSSDKQQDVRHLRQSMVSLDQRLSKCRMPREAAWIVSQAERVGAAAWPSQV